MSGHVEAEFLTIESARSFRSADLSANGLAFWGLSSITLPDGTRFEGENLSLSVAEALASVPGFDVGSGAVVGLVVDRSSRSLSWTVTDVALELELIPSPGARLLIAAPACVAEACEQLVEQPRAIQLTTTAETPFSMRFDLPVGRAPIAERIAVSNVLFWELERSDGTTYRRGGLLAGSLRFRDVPERPIHLDRGTVLAIEPVELVVRALEVQPDSLYSQLSGGVEDVSVEIGESSISLMPTQFDRYSRSPHIRLWLGLFSVLLGAGFTLGQWLARRN